MRQFFTGVLLSLILVFTGCQDQQAGSKAPVTSATKDSSDSVLDGVVVEASCAQCQFGIKEPAGCDLAIRVDGEVFFVEGTGIDDHGDAHGAEGLCNSILKARVTGRVENGRFKASAFEVVKE